MSLDRFINKPFIVSRNPDDVLTGQSLQTQYSADGAIVGNKWTAEVNEINGLSFTSVEPTTISLHPKAGVEAHLFSSVGENKHVSSTYGMPFNVDYGNVEDSFVPKINRFPNVDLSKLISNVDISAGTYITVFNFHVDIIGSAQQNAFYIEEMSSDRTEIYLRSIILSGVSPNIREQYINDSNTARSFKNGDLVINFGNNEVYTIINQGTWTAKDGLRVKLLKPLHESIIEGSSCWICEELADPIIERLEFYRPLVDTSIRIRRPNFEVDTEYNTITETDFSSWNELLGDNLSTSQQVIDKLFSGSLAGVDIGIDYSGFENFIHFSSANERIANFKYKMQLLEFYESQISTLEEASGDNTGSLQNSLVLNQGRRDNVIGSFDGFEKWLYEEPTASLFTPQAVYEQEHNNGNPTHLEGGILGAKHYQIQPWPKFLSASRWYPHHTTSSLADTWYTAVAASASFFDSENPHALVSTIPEHIQIDPNNNQYELFVNMIGHHFDILYSYTDNLAKTYHPIEHPKLGHGKDTIYEVAKSLGWSLANGKQASQLWQYKLGTDATGSRTSTGSIFTKADEEITTEVWRRITNNLPFLLKTKGTARSVKALMNTYGIPQTLLSIREYGGPKVHEDVPTLIEDRFTYGLEFDEEARIIFPNNHVSQSFQNYGIQRGTGNHINVQGIQTHEIRFRPYTGSSMILMSNVRSSDGWDDKTSEPNGSAVWHVAIQHTGSYSGSANYGRAHFIMGVAGGVGGSTASMTEWLPLYDGNFWNLSVGYYGSSTAVNNISNNTDTTYELRVQQASDYISGKIVHSGSLSFTPTVDQHWKRWSSDREDHRAHLVLGGATGSYDYLTTDNGLTASFGAPDSSGSVGTPLASDSVRGSGIAFPQFFSGSMQEYRGYLEYINDDTFDLHTLNPTSYVSSYSPTSSFDTLVRHYPLGTDLNAIDHSTGIGLIISSSHPANHIKDFGNESHGFSGSNSYASASGFATPLNAQRGNYEPVEETYYVQGVSLGGVLPRSQKIRFDTNGLTRHLSATNTAEFSKFDFAPIDSNRLGLFYSMADQINKDIFNHIGDIALDDYIGDPDDQYELTYRDLNQFATEYWKKYTDRNDINAYMRIFSQFDFSLFNQIKQLIPARADDAMGLLVEPNALERSKVRIAKPPAHESAHFETKIPSPIPSGSGVYLTWEGSASAGPSLQESETVYHKGSGGPLETGNYFFNVSGSDYCVTPSDMFEKEVFPVDEAPSASGSMVAAYTLIEPNANGLHWNSFSLNNFLENDENASHPVITGLSTHTDKLRVQFETKRPYDTIRDFEINIRHQSSSALNNAGGNVHMTTKLITTPDNAHGMHLGNKVGSLYVLSGSGDVVGRVIQEQEKTIGFLANTEQTERIRFSEVHLSEGQNLTVEIQYRRNSRDIKPVVDFVQMVHKVLKVGYGAYVTYIDDQRPSDIYMKKILHYSTGSFGLSRYDKDKLKVISASNGDHYSSSLEIYDYMDDEIFQYDMVTFLGSQLTAPNINAASGYSQFGYAPIVEVWLTNPNTAYFLQNPDLALMPDSPSNILVVGGSVPVLDSHASQLTAPTPTNLAY